MAKMVQNNESTTTTQPPSPPTTSPYSDVGDVGSGGGIGFSITGKRYAGGIDPTYKIPTQINSATSENPYYYSTEDWQILLRLPTAQVQAVQQKLMKAYPGFKPATLGDRYDSQTIKYFKDALGRINKFSAEDGDPYKLRGKSTIDALGILAKNPTSISGGRSSGAGYTYAKSSPLDLKSAFQQVAQQSLGRDLDEGTLNRMVEAFQNQQVQYQKQSRAGGVVTQTPSAETFAQNKIQSDFGTEVDTRKLDNIFGAIDAAMTRGGQ